MVDWGPASKERPQEKVPNTRWISTKIKSMRHSVRSAYKFFKISLPGLKSH